MLNEELTILRSKKDYFGCAEDKIQAVTSAIGRLNEAVLYQSGLKKEQVQRLSFFDINPDEARSTDLSTYDAMLDAKFSVWLSALGPWTEGGQEFSGHPEGYDARPSLRQALNISRNNIFNILAVQVGWGPLWGKTDTLTAIEGRVKRLPVE